MKILVIILSERRDHRYIKMEKAIRETWAPKLLQNDSIVDVLYTYGREHRGIRGEVEKHGDQLYINHPEGYFMTSGKNVKTLKYVYENYEFDYIFRTNLSAYIHADNLVNYMQDKPREKFYHGITGQHPDNKKITFVSGSGCFLSRDIVKLIAAHPDQIKADEVDDIALAVFLHGKVKPSTGPRVDLLQRFRSWSGIQDSANYHYRVHTTEGNKGWSPVAGGVEPAPERRLDDVLKIKAIHNHFYPTD